MPLQVIFDAGVQFCDKYAFLEGYNETLAVGLLCWQAGCSVLPWSAGLPSRPFQSLGQRILRPAQIC